MKFSSNYTRRPWCAWYYLPCLSKNLYLKLVKRVYVDTSVLLRCYYALILPILMYCSPLWGSASECHLQLLERQIYSVARLCHDQTLSSLCHQRHVAALCMLYKVNSNSNCCLFGELRFYQSSTFSSCGCSYPLEFEVSRCFPPAQTRVWNDLPYTVFNTGTLDGFKGAVNRWLMLEFVFQIFRGQVLVGLRMQFMNKIFSHLGMSYWF